MAGVMPSFITGANAKIVIDDITLAFAQDVSYQISINTIPIRAMGKLEVSAHEPISYNVTGSITVVRYTKDAGSSLSRIYTTTLVDTDGDPATAAVPVITEVVGSPRKLINGANEKGNSVDRWNTKTSNIGLHLNPGKMLSSLTFDLEIITKINSTGVVDAESVIKVRDCRITGKTGSLNKRGLMMDQFSFNAILVDNDEEFKASGTGWGEFNKE
jgi:hypothetical protein